MVVFSRDGTTATPPEVQASPPEEVRIGAWLFQPDRQQLVGPQGVVPLSAEASRVLLRLSERPGEVVRREEIAEAISGSVEEHPQQVTRCVRRLRLALNDTATDPEFIETVPRHGYRLIAAVETTEGMPVKTTRYRRLAQIGDGGMGVVYKAEDTKLRRLVALKFLPAAWSRDPVAKERFLMEARAAAALDHPNICTLHEVDEAEDGQMFFVMAYYEGETVKSRMSRGTLTWQEAVDVARKVAAGLAAAHGNGIVHRDIKPANIMLLPRGEVKILDFGVAKSAGTARLTRTGTAIGTPTHMSPEQVKGWEVDQRTDLWSLGVVLYEMIAGKLPFRGDLEHAVLYNIVNSEPDPLAALGINVPPAVEWVVAKALAKDPDLRYSSAGEMLEDLEGLARGTLPGTRELKIAVPQAPAASIAVLPFADLSPDRDQEYFCDGIAEELINALARVDQMRVVSRTSAFQFKGKDEDVRTIGQRLRVNAVLTGSVRKAGQRLRITVELVNASDRYNLWAERFDRDLEDVFAVQDEIARTVADTLKAKLVGERGPVSDQATLIRPHTEDLQAYQLYLKGRHYWNKRTEEALQKSVGCFRQAIDRDPSYARAYAGLADAYATVGIYGALPPERVMPAARAAAAQALERDDSLAEAHASLGCVKAVYDWSWRESEEAFRRALELDPNYATGHQWYAMNHLVPVGRFEEAVAAIERALELDPLSLAINASLGVAAYFARRYEKAEEDYRRALELDEVFPMAHYFLGQALTELDRAEEAIEEIGKACELTGHGSPEMRAALAVAHAAAGQQREARQILAELLGLGPKRYVSPSLLAQVHASLGDREAALLGLEEAYRIRAVDLAWIRVRPVFDTLREEERFQVLVAKMGLTEGTGTAGHTRRERPIPPSE